MSKKLRCFLKKFTQLTKILHDRRSRRSRQIPSLVKVTKYMEREGSVEIVDNTLTTKTSSQFILKYDLTIGNDHGGTEKVLFDLH